MKKKIAFLCAVLCFSFVIPTKKVKAFVPNAAHLLYLVVKKIKRPAGLKVLQTKVFENQEDIDGNPFEIKERIFYLSYNKLRSDIISNTKSNKSFSVESDFKFIKVIDDNIVSYEKEFIDIYTDILLYRDYKILLEQLLKKGIDTKQVSFQRHNDTICYLIGKPSDKKKYYDETINKNQKENEFSGLWIEKETLFPIKYVLKIKKKKIEYLYENWRSVSRTWYPNKVSIIVDNRLFATIGVNSFKLKSDFSSSLFDIKKIEESHTNKIFDNLDIIF